MMRLCALCAAFVAMAACDLATSPGCAPDPDAVLVVSVSDPVLPRLSTDASAAVVTITDGSFVDTLRFGAASAAPDALFALYAWHPVHTGIYTIRVDLPPYQSWTRAGARVATRGCVVD